MRWQGEEILVDFMEGEVGAQEQRMIQTEISLSTRLRKSLKDLESTKWWVRQALEVQSDTDLTDTDLTKLHNQIMSKINLK